MDPGDPQWYRDAVIYQVRLRSFKDSTADGIGDFRGLTSKLDYIESLGVSAIWLLPFYPSPLTDDGYDISDYMGVHPDCGTIDDFKGFVDEAHRRGLRVITEVVLNHTSDQHPWFGRARQAPPGSPLRDWYVWSDSPDKYVGVRIIFKDFEKSNWTWDPVAGAYFWHRFYSSQPDLNFDNPEVRAAVLEVVSFWLDLGVDGLRLDAVPYLFEREGTSCENLRETHDFLRELRRVVDQRHPGRMLLAEANMWPEDAVAYFGAGDECHMAFNFPIMPRLYLALATGDRAPVEWVLKWLPELPPGAQWATFLRNHDELTLEMVTPEERDFAWDFYCKDRRAVINLGIRRRLAPLLEGDRRKIELLNLLLLALPGTPVLYYGDEIGMGDNLALPDRHGVRTPMQWTSGKNAGFSEAEPFVLPLPVVATAPYSFVDVNVEAQQPYPPSLLNWTREALKIRQSHARLFGRGTMTLVDSPNQHILTFVREYEGRIVLVAANLSDAAQATECNLLPWSARVPVDLWTGERWRTGIGNWPYRFTFGPYGVFWLELSPT